MQCKNNIAMILL